LYDGVIQVADDPTVAQLGERATDQLKPTITTVRRSIKVLFDA